MSALFQNPDGANSQARATLAYLQGYIGIDSSYSTERHAFLAEPLVFRWHNCREQGYVVSMRSRMSRRQINIAWYEHRNSDSICAVQWEQHTVHGNPPTLGEMLDANVMKDKYDVSHSVNYGCSQQMAAWIFERLTAFWDETKDEKTELAERQAVAKAGA